MYDVKMSGNHRNLLADLTFSSEVKLESDESDASLTLSGVALSSGPLPNKKNYRVPDR